MNRCQIGRKVSSNTLVWAVGVLVFGFSLDVTSHAQVCSCATLDCTPPAPVAVSPELCPFGSDEPQFFPHHDFGVLPAPTKTARIRVQAHAHVDTNANSLKLLLNGQQISFCPHSCLFRSATLYDDCAPVDDLATAGLTLSAETFNNIVNGQSVIIDGIPDGYIDPFLCSFGEDCPAECIPDIDFCTDGFPYCQNEACCDALCAGDEPPSYAIISLIYDHPDCNGNNLQDACEIANNPGLDCNDNGILDACELLDPGINCDIRTGNMVIDACQIANNPDLDCDANGMIDSCEIFQNLLLDCDSDGNIDSCEIEDDPDKDCDGNSILDCCEVVNHPSCACGLCDPNCQGANCIECQPDLNHDCHPDQCSCETHADCDDGFDCTVDTCEPANICKSIQINANCQTPGSFCDSNDTCNPNDPNADPLTGCVDRSPCAGDPNNPICDETTDSCVQCLENSDCDDGIECTVNDCAGDNECLFIPDDAFCDDAIDCTADTCTGGGCQNLPEHAVCDDGLFCNGAETCHPANGCQAGIEPCPTFACNEINDQCSDCKNNGDCDDFDVCTGDVCTQGLCEFIELDGDNDGVPDCDDFCPNTPPGAPVDENGCESGACCVGEGCLKELDFDFCEVVLGGVFVGPGVDCDDVGVCQPGACCFADGACDNIVEGLCDDLGGLFLGIDSTCANSECPNPRGACCIGQVCVPNQEQDNCMAAGGSWGGALSQCEPATCVKPTIERVDSVLTHGMQTPIDIPLNLIETSGIEPRRGGPIRFVFVISKDIDPASVAPVSVAISCAALGDVAVSDIHLTDGRTLDVSLDQPLSDLAGTPNCCTISFPGIRTAMNESIAGTFDVIALPGDLNFDFGVSGGDAAIIKPWFGATAGVDLPFPQLDFDLNGVVTGGDYALIKPLLGHVAAPCPAIP